LLTLITVHHKVNRLYIMAYITCYYCYCKFSLTNSSHYTVSGKKVPLYFFAITLPNPNRSSKFFYLALSRKFAIKKTLNIPPPFTHVATIPCKTVVLKNFKLHCRPILKTFNDNEQLHSKIICSVNSHILT